jgi:hypothetical protein
MDSFPPRVRLTTRQQRYQPEAADALAWNQPALSRADRVRILCDALARASEKDTERWLFLGEMLRELILAAEATARRHNPRQGLS